MYTDDVEPFLIYFRLTSKNLHQARRILRTFLLLLLTGSLEAILVESCHMLRQIGNCHRFTSTKPSSKKYQYVRGERLSGRPFCGEAVTSAPHLLQVGSLFSVGGYAVSCTASSKQTSETKAQAHKYIPFGV
jgi:hypothetical protein